MTVRMYIGLPVEGYVTDNVSTIPVITANLSQTTREKFVTDLAAISRGKDSSKNPTTRFQALLTEAAPNSKSELVEGYNGNCSRPMEFCPIVCEFNITRTKDEGITYVLDQDENVKFSYNNFSNKIARYSYIEMDKDDNKKIVVYTNLRALVNAGVPYASIPFMNKVEYYIRTVDGYQVIGLGGESISIRDIEISHMLNESTGMIEFQVKDLLDSGIALENILDDIKENRCSVDKRYRHFKAIKIKAPMMCWAQWPMTHTALSKESQSDRVSYGEGYWLPEDFDFKVRRYMDNFTSHTDRKLASLIEQMVVSAYNDHDPKRPSECFLYLMEHDLPQSTVQSVLRELGYKKEIWSRAPYYFKYKECVVTGWKNDPTTWEHSFLERSTEPDHWKNWTQKETKELLQCVKQVIEDQ